MKAPVVVGITGASGAAIGLRVLDVLAHLGFPAELVVSAAGETTLSEEVGPDALAGVLTRRHPIDAVGSVIGSGSYPTSGMIVAPCSMRSLASIAHGLADNLLSRAADVHLKERRPLVLVAREAPLNLAHLRAMTAVTEMGGIVLPPVPAFYLKPESVAEIVDQIARRAIDLLRIAPPSATAWDGGATG